MMVPFAPLHVVGWTPNRDQLLVFGYVYQFIGRSKALRHTCCDVLGAPDYAGQVNAGQATAIAPRFLAFEMSPNTSVLFLGNRLSYFRVPSHPVRDDDMVDCRVVLWRLVRRCRCWVEVAGKHR